MIIDYLAYSLLYIGVLLTVITLFLFLREQYRKKIHRKQWISIKQIEYADLFDETEDLYREWQASSGEDWIWG